jgi:hypothetical protein
MDENCGGCRFRGPEAGECHRFPPQIVWGVNARGDQLAIAVRPRVSDGDWCGEHRFPPSEPLEALRAMEAVSRMEAPAPTAGGLPKRAKKRK